MDEVLIETWRIHSRTLLFFLDALSAEALNAAPSAKGKSVAEQFAHIHNVRLMWLKASAPELLESLAKLEKTDALNVETLRNALASSAEAVAALVQKGIENGGKVKGFKPHVTAFVGYLIAHEWYHLGKSDMTLRQAGQPPDDKTHYGLWEWGVR